MNNNQSPFPKHWAFVLNPIVLPSIDQYELAPKLFVRKAKEHEVIAIKQTLTQCIGSPFNIPRELNYETDRRETPSGPNTKNIDAIPLARADWRYHIVTNEGDQNALYRSHLAINTTAAPLEISALTFGGPSLTGWRGDFASRYFRDFTPFPASRLSIDDLNEARDTINEFVPFFIGGELCEKHPEVQRAFLMYDSLSMLNETSEFHVIGLFAIIEMMITHNPQLEDRGDSITHQMQAKLPLLMRRFRRPISTKQHFGDTDPKKVWSALYSYRSALAHGGVANFASSQLKPIKSAEAASEYLHAVVKGLLRHVLIEPLLFLDLKNC
ncbi:HEPN domain-containing protein [Paraburkholderia sp. D15]|uniref:HEPN domain-containing protein n=1 Tax=Paraburkholderia sp. D15 TaxID=2880218 RepID=UPI002479528D|nr:HEPN domain-containing protein [Paraburkholderia sp. D15]WGS49823.1 HEPN domain-containing protein [Paraburkholderia sp. D15]